MKRKTTSCLRALAPVFLAGMACTPLYAGLDESEVLLLYNPLDSESNAIAQHYLAVHPGVASLALPINYADPADPADPGEFAATRYYITPASYFQEIWTPVRAYTDADPNIISMVTTRGLPAAVTSNFAPQPITSSHPDWDPQNPFSGMHASVEAALSALGIQTPTEPWRPGLGFANPYKGLVGIPFREFTENPGNCFDEGPSYAGQMYLVSRLDAASVNPEDNIPDHLTNVLDLIDRSANLIVNKFGTTVVIDDLDTDIWMMRSRAGFGSLCADGWCTYRDDTTAFLHGSVNPGDCCCQPGDICQYAAHGCGTYDPAIEGTYAAYPELVHSGMGRNHCLHADCGASACCVDKICVDYARHYDAHPAGLFAAIESFCGWRLHATQYANQGSVLDWIAAGGSFACGSVAEPGLGHVFHGAEALPNLYKHGLSWGEAVYSSLSNIAEFQTPIGDPLATVTVYSPDVNEDGVADILDHAALQAAIQEGVTCDPTGPCPLDVNHDGVIDTLDFALLVELLMEAFGRTCLPADCPDPLPESGFDCTAMEVSPILCRADITGDLNVDFSDLVTVIAAWGCPCEEADIDGDGSVGFTDLLSVQAAWGPVSLQLDYDDSGAVDCGDYTYVSDRIGTSDLSADFDCDGDVDGSDLFYVVQYTADLDDDGDVDCDDAAAVSDFIATGDPFDPQYDINCDGVVDIDDVGTVLRYGETIECDPSGACCLGTTCVVIPLSTCTGASGEFLGEGVPCGQTSCK